MKFLSPLLLLILTSLPAFAASDYQKISRFFTVTNHQAISSVSLDEANNMYYAFCSRAGEFHYSRHSSVENSIDFDGARDFSTRCNLLNKQRHRSPGKSLVCVVDKETLNEKIDALVKPKGKKSPTNNNKSACNTVGIYKISK